MLNPPSTQKQISSAKLRADLTSCLNEAHYLENTFVIERHNEPLAVLVPFKMYQKLMGMESKHPDTVREELEAKQKEEEVAND